MKVLKGVTALRFFKFPELRNKYWKGKLWSPSYYVGTAGRVSAETIQRYIEEQRGTLTQFIHPSKWVVFLHRRDKNKYGVNNLYLYRFSGGFRGIYTVLRTTRETHVWILDVLDHVEYDRRFGY